MSVSSHSFQAQHDDWPDPLACITTKRSAASLVVIVVVVVAAVSVATTVIFQ